MSFVTLTNTVGLTKEPASRPSGWPSPPTSYYRAFFNALADVGLHALVLFLRRHWSDGALWLGRVADWECAHALHNAALDCVQPFLRHEEPCPCGAGLTAVQKGHGQRGRDRLAEVGVIEQDGRRFAT
jgi:hypothetical protein